MTMGMALGDGLLQGIWFSDSSEDEGSPRRARPKLPRTQEVESWQEISEPSSAVVCELN